MKLTSVHIGASRKTIKWKSFVMGHIMMKSETKRIWRQLAIARDVDGVSSSINAHVMGTLWRIHGDVFGMQTEGTSREDGSTWCVESRQRWKNRSPAIIGPGGARLV